MTDYVWPTYMPEFAVVLEDGDRHHPARRHLNSFLSKVASEFSSVPLIAFRRAARASGASKCAKIGPSNCNLGDPMPNSLIKPPRKEDVQKSIDACLDNGGRLMDDALQLEFQERGGTRLAISMLAQEEYAKAFLLYMVLEELLPWDADLLRVMRNHECKHLLAIVIEYIEPEWDTLEELQAIIKAEYDLGDRFPPRVSSALNILYWEKIRRRNFEDDDNEYEPDVVAIAFRARDRVKQDALYIDLDKSCRVKNGPMEITREDAATEYKRASRYASIVLRLVGPDPHEPLQLKKLKEAIKVVFWQKYKPVTTEK